MPDPQHFDMIRKGSKQKLVEEFEKYDDFYRKN